MRARLGSHTHIHKARVQHCSPARALGIAYLAKTKLNYLLQGIVAYVRWIGRECAIVV